MLIRISIVLFLCLINGSFATTDTNTTSEKVIAAVQQAKELRIPIDKNDEVEVEKTLEELLNRKQQLIVGIILLERGRERIGTSPLSHYYRELLKVTGYSHQEAVEIIGDYHGRLDAWLNQITEIYTYQKEMNSNKSLKPR